MFKLLLILLILAAIVFAVTLFICNKRNIGLEELFKIDTKKYLDKIR